MPTALADLLDTRDLDTLQRWLDSHDILEVAAEVSRLSPVEMAVPFRLLDRDRALQLFEALDPEHQRQVLQGLRDEEFKHLVEGMDPDDRARLVGELPAKVAHRVLQGLSPRERALTAELLGYPENSAGRIMSPEIVTLQAAMTVADALTKVRRVGADAETIYTLPVTNDHRRLLGMVSLRDLVLAAADARVGELMDTRVRAVHTSDDQEVAARLIQEADLLALPVLDSEDRVVGVITVDDAMEILEAEETEDQALQGGSQPLGRPYLSVPVFGLARSRLVWLMVLIVAATLTVNVLQVFEDVLAEVVTLALFVPLLIGTGGNAGSQAATTVIRAMALGEVRFVDLPRVVWREARVGIIEGLVLGLLGLVPVSLLFGTDIGLVVAITLTGICTWASFVGSSLPLLAKRLGLDPAVLSAPLVSTLVDATGLIIYFLVARAILGV